MRDLLWLVSWYWYWPTCRFSPFQWMWNYFLFWFEFTVSNCYLVTPLGFIFWLLAVAASVWDKLPTYRPCRLIRNSLWSQRYSPTSILILPPSKLNSVLFYHIQRHTNLTKNLPISSCYYLNLKCSLKIHMIVSWLPDIEGVVGSWDLTSSMS